MENYLLFFLFLFLEYSGHLPYEMPPCDSSLMLLWTVHMLLKFSEDVNSNMIAGNIQKDKVFLFEIWDTLHFNQQDLNAARRKLFPDKP